MSAFPSHLGPYTIDREIGRGGMGVVYLGRDTKLDRPVAIKALPEHLAQDPERLARFEREAKLLASLSHPNIAGVYGLEEQGGTRFLVMEFVEGETLAEIIERGPIATDEVLRIGAQVAAGVETAHEAGVIHRDLKPGNIVVTPRGEAKVLDFGLAKEIEARGSSLDLSHSPTATFPTGRSPATAQGQIMGTAAYVSPEQARGKQLDRRTDIWSFGCVLYEMLTGLGPFAGETATDSFGAILHKDPDWSRLPPNTPPTVQLLLKRMLAKDASRRLRDIGDARVELDEALRDPSATSLNLAGAALRAGSGQSSRAGWVAAALLAIVVLALGAVILLSPEPPAPNPMRLEVRFGAEGDETGTEGAQFAISPDGQTLVMVTSTESAMSGQLHVRRLDAFRATPLAGTGGAEHPTFSPDGNWVCYFADGKLRKVAIAGGAPITLCDAPGDARGASWGDGGLITFTPDTTTGVWLVSENGGVPRQLTTLDEEADERSHRWPHFLPGSRAILFTSQIRGNDFDDGTIEVVRVDDGERTVIHRGGSNPKFTWSGHLVFGRAGTIFACRFDPTSLRTLSSAVPVLEGIRTEPPNGGVAYAISHTGTLVFEPGTGRAGRMNLAWVNRAEQRVEIGSQQFVAPVASLSPDGRRIALQIYSEGADYDIWVYEIERQVLSRLTVMRGNEMNPIWSPDGTRLAYAAIVEGVPKIFVQRADGSDEPKQITSGPAVDFPTSWSPDGSRIAFHRQLDGAESFGTWTVEIGPDGVASEPEPFVADQFENRYPVFSPDGTQIAYSSAQTGRPEVYIRSFPRTGGRVQVSIDGGTYPVWSNDGSELFYWWNGRVRACSIERSESGEILVGRPLELFTHRPIDDWYYPQFSVDRTSERFLVLSGQEIEEVQSPGASMIMNWFTELERLTGKSGGR